MRRPKSAYENKKAYDPGRLRHGIAIMNYSVSELPEGGQTINEQQILATKAGKDEVSTYRQAQIQDGFQNYNKFQYFVIRNRKNFYPDKTMHINYNGSSYVIIDVIELDDPCTFLKILCAVSK